MDMEVAIFRIHSLCIGLMLFLTSAICITLTIPSIPTPAAETFSTTDFHVRFTDVSEEKGFQDVGLSNCAWGDYDRDGDQDLLINGFRLFRNNGSPDWDFTDVTESTGLDNSYSGIWGDYDNDGFLDIFQVTSNPDVPDKLWHNTGDGTFTDATTTSRIVDTYNTPAAGWGDYDADGFIDLYIANYEGSGSGGSGATDEPLPDFLWHNNGDGTFTDVSTSSGIRDEQNHCGRGVNWGDFDNDGDLDIYISNYRLHENVLWENQGDGTFVNVAHEKGVHGVPRTDSEGTTRYGHTIGSAWGDMDNDLDLDLFVANLVHKDIERGRYCDDSKLYENQGPGDDYSFIDLRPGCGMPHKEYMAGEDELWSDCSWGDVDIDGDLDLFITSVYTDIDYAHSYLYINNGDGTFTDMALDAGVRVWASWGCSMCDYDQDGDLDIVVGGKDGIDAGNNPSRLHLFRNEGMPHSWLTVTVSGSATLNNQGEEGEEKVDEEGIHSTNTAGIGARVTITTADGITQIREVEGGKGTCANQDSLELEFGFGRETDPVDISVRFPSGVMCNFSDVQLNQRLLIIEKEHGESARIERLEVTANTMGSCEMESGQPGSGTSGYDEGHLFIMKIQPLLFFSIFLVLLPLLIAGTISKVVLSSDKKPGTAVRQFWPTTASGSGPTFITREMRALHTTDEVLSNPHKPVHSYPLLIIVIVLLFTGPFMGCLDDDDDDEDRSITLPPLPPDYDAQAEEMGLSREMSSETFDYSDRTGDGGEFIAEFIIEDSDIAFLRLTLEWQDEIDLAPPNPTGDNVVKNMGDTFALFVETPWNIEYLSPAPNNYHHTTGELIYEIRTDDLSEYSFMNYPGSETGGDFTVHVLCLDCGDQREFGNFGPEQTNLFTEDNANNWDLTIQYAVWTG